MNLLSDVFYAATTVIACVFVVLLIRTYRRGKNLPALQLALIVAFILININPLLVGFQFSQPATPDEVTRLTFLFTSSTMLGITGIVMLSLFIDYSSARRSMSILTWVITASGFFCVAFLFQPGIYVLDVVADPVFGLVITSSYDAVVGTMVLLTFYTGTGVTVARLWSWAIKLGKEKGHPATRRAALQFAGSFTGGFLSFVLLNLLKRFAPLILGLDVLSFSLFFIPIIVLYIRRPGSFALLGKLPDSVTVLTGATVPLFEYVFSTRAFIDLNQSDLVMVKSAMEAMLEGLGKDHARPASMLLEDQHIARFAGKHVIAITRGPGMSPAFDTFLHVMVEAIDDAVDKHSWNLHLFSTMTRDALKQVVAGVVSRHGIH